mmetsp:Transcript_31757/g.48711  ORF Transcript_31757/g.48711 Transcript_31757/m.48711 type:complete len:136 (-) Transcript_31757:1064-1471(-)
MQIDKMRRYNITKVLKVNQQSLVAFPLKNYNIELYKHHMEDHSTYELSVTDDLEPCHAFINKKTGFNHSVAEVGSPEGTLVVCTAGMSRSAMICITYLMRHKNMSYNQAYLTCKAARKYVLPNEGFVNFMKDYEQ